MKTCKLCDKKIYAKNLCINHYHSLWRKNNRESFLEAQRKYRKNNLELCRERVRINQRKLNNKKRFGGLRIKVLERDNYQCQMCNKDISGNSMSCIHHKDENKTNNVMSNMISLCRSCHPKIHYCLKKYQFTSKQLKEKWSKYGIQYFNR